MPFQDSFSSTVPPIQEGEVGQGAKIVLSTTSYENGLKIGRFAKWDTGRLDNLDGSGTPVLAGVVLRNTNDLLELPGEVADGSPFFTSEPNQSYIRQGLTTVKLADGSGTPEKFGAVYTVNEVDNADNGKAKSSSQPDTMETTAEFIKAVENDPTIWWIRLK